MARPSLDELAEEVEDPFLEDPFADDLESMAALSDAGAAGLEVEDMEIDRVPSPSIGEPVVGRLVEVGKGDTVWAIALQYYGNVDSAILTQIFRNNAGIVDPRRLEVGSHIYLPFLSPEQMVRSGGTEGYKVLLAETPDAASLAQVALWVESVLPGVRFARETKGSGRPVEILYAVGFGSRSDALAAARTVMSRYEGYRAESG